jgi:hypothetical protein
MSFGNISNSNSARQSLTTLSIPYDIKQVTIGANDIEIETDYPNMLCFGFKNEGATDGSVCIYTKSDAATKKTINLISHEISGTLPLIKTVCGSDNGSTSGLELTLYFFKR